MQPNQPQKPSGPSSQPSYHPPEYTNPNVSPGQSGSNDFLAPIQQHPSGQYEVVPPPTPGVAPSGHNPYEFIMNPNTPKKRSFGSGSGLLTRIAVLGGGLVVLVILIAIVISVLGPKSSVPALTAIAERQQEIIRIATAAKNQTTGQDTANLVATVSASVSSSQQQVVTYLATRGTKLSPKVLVLDKNPQTDTLLTSAANANNYDTAVAQVLAQQLITYEGLLQTTFKQTSSTSTKQLLQDCYTSTNKLLQQAKSLPANSNS